ncbi:MAG: hypothetical protein WAN41_00415 [Candidatus Sulfotelmatobacter sp.]
MPPVLPRTGAARGNSWSFEVVVVEKRARRVAGEILRETKGVSLRMTDVKIKQAAAGSPRNAKRTGG